MFRKDKMLRFKTNLRVISLFKAQGDTFLFSGDLVWTVTVDITVTSVNKLGIPSTLLTHLAEAVPIHQLRGVGISPPRCPGAGTHATPRTDHQSLPEECQKGSYLYLFHCNTSKYPLATNIMIVENISSLTFRQVV